MSTWRPFANCKVAVLEVRSSLEKRGIHEDVLVCNLREEKMVSLNRPSNIELAISTSKSVSLSTIVYAGDNKKGVASRRSKALATRQPPA